MSNESIQLEQVYSRLAKYRSPTVGDFEQFMSAIRRANEIYDAMPDEIELRIFRAVLPRYYGTDQRTSALGLVDEAIQILGALRVICGYKLHDLTMGISEGFSRQQFRTAVLCCRALYEEAATAKYYCDQVMSAIEVILQIPPSSFRADRLSRLAKEREKFKSFLDKISLPGKVLRKWHGVRKTKYNVFEDFKLDEKDPLYPGFSLSSFRTLKWQGKIPAPYYYSVLCEATHRDYLAIMSEFKSSLNKYVEKARRVTM